MRDKRSFSIIQIRYDVRDPSDVLTVVADGADACCAWFYWLFQDETDISRVCAVLKASCASGVFCA